MFRQLPLKISIVVFLALLTQAAYAQSTAPMRIELLLSSDTVFVGDTFDLTVHFEYTSEMGQIEVGQPEFPDMLEFEKVGSIQYSQRQDISRNSITGKHQARAHYNFTRTYRAVTPGEFIIHGDIPDNLVAMTNSRPYQRSIPDMPIRLIIKRFVNDENRVRNLGGSEMVHLSFA